METQRYTVRALRYGDGRIGEGIVVEVVQVHEATSPEEALTMLERSGVDYAEAEVSDESGRQVAVYDAGTCADCLED